MGGYGNDLERRASIIANLEASVSTPGFPGGSVVENPPAKAEDFVQYLDQEDPLEKEMGIAHVYLPGKSQGRGSWWGYCPWGRIRAHLLQASILPFTELPFLLLRHCYS